MPMEENIHQGAITYPFFTPNVKTEPPIAGPMALPTALKDVAKPFNVPKTLILLAEFVSKIVEEGKAKIVAKHLIIITAKTPTI